MIHFRQANDAAQGFELWHVEFYEEHADDRLVSGAFFPIGTAYVCALPHLPGAAQLNFILVADAWRRRGIAAHLVRACKERWPRLTATGPMGPDSRALLAREGVPFPGDDDE